MSRSNPIIKSGDIVEVAYVSSTDPQHSRRHHIIWRRCKVVSIVNLQHPNIKAYKGMDYWYKATVVMLDSNESITIGMCQLKLIKDIPNMNEIEKVVDTKRNNMLNDINARLRHNMIVDKYDEDNKITYAEGGLNEYGEKPKATAYGKGKKLRGANKAIAESFPF